MEIFMESMVCPLFSFFSLATTHTRLFSRLSKQRHNETCKAQTLMKSFLLLPLAVKFSHYSFLPFLTFVLNFALALGTSSTKRTQ